MKMLRCLFMLLVAAVLGAAQKNADAALGAARHLEEAEGNYPAAIEAYKKILAQYGKDRGLAAKALVRMGRCYEKLGDAEARKAYERVVREFGEQKDPAETARRRLSALERARGLSQPSGITLRRVWVGGDGWLEGSPSPDGRYHSFTDWETGDLGVRELATGQNRRLTNKGTWKDSDEYAEASVISGDSRQIAYGWSNKENYYELRVSGIDGSKPHTVYRDKEFGFYVEPYQWTADGKQILAARQRTKEEAQIVLIPVSGGPVRVLKSLAHYPWHISLSPDQRFLAYDVLGRTGVRERDIFLFSVEGGQEVPLVRQPFDDYGPVWMPDGKKVLFVSDRTGTNGFWVIDVVDGKPQGIPRILKDGVGRVVRPNGFTRQGAFYYSTRTSMADLYVAELDPAEGKMVRQPAPLALRFVGSNSSPSWSPDGRSLAYYSLRAEGPAGYEPTLVILSVETGEARDIRVKLDQVFYPVRWFPDGKSVLVGAWDSPKRNQVAFYRVNTETGDHRLIRSSPGPGPARSEISPDGRTFFFFTGGEPKVRGGVIARDLASGQEREIARVPYLSGGWSRAAVSPDGRFLAFGCPLDDQWTALRLVPTAGGELRELFRFQRSETIGNDELAWTPDGRNLLFVRRTGKDGMPELWRLPAAGGAPQRTGLAMESMRLIAPHPDGRRIAFETGSLSGEPNELWVLENFLAGAESKAVAEEK